MSTEEIAAFMKKLHELGYTFVDVTGKVVPLSTAIESLNDTKLEDLKREAESAKKALAEILGGYDIEINLETSDLGESKENIKTLSNMLSTFRGKDGKIDFSIEGAAEVATMLEYTIRQKQELTKPAIMEFDMSGVDGEVASAVTTIQAFVDAYNEIEVAAMLGLDTTEAQQKKDELWQQIQDINPEILVNLGIDPSSEQAALQTIYSMDGESIANALVEYDVNTDQVEAYKSSDKDTEAEVDYKADFSAVVKAKAPDKTAKLKYTADFTAVASTPAPKKYGTIYYSASYAGGTTTAKKAQSSSKGAYTGFTSEARVGGTAYAGGNWATKKDEFSLVGEIAPEIIVDTKTGTWKLLGEHGTEFANIPKGSIIFNHLQTKALLSKGKISGRGKAYVGGTTGKTNPATGTSYTSSYKKSSSSSASSSSSSSLSSSTEEASEFLETIDWIETLLDRINRKVSSLDLVTSSVFKNSTERLSSAKKELSAITEELSAQEAAAKAYFSVAEEISLSDEYKELVRNGTLLIEDITDEALSENISKYKELYEKGLDAASAVESLKEQFSELYQTSFNIISTKMDSIIASVETKQGMIEESISQAEAMGRKVSSAYYLALIDSQQELVGKLLTKRNDLQKAMDEAVNSGAIEKYSEAWYEMVSNIDDVTTSINEATTSIIEFQNELRTLEWDTFDDGISSIEHLNDETDFLLDLLDRKDSFSDSGKITDEGLTKLGLYAQKYNTYMAQADLYGEELLYIERQLAEDPSNIDLIERKQELLEAQRECIEAAEDEKDSMIELVEEGIQAQLDALSELIDKYTDSLDSAKSLYDYQKKIAEKTKEIASIEKQISAYEGSDSEELKKTVQELKISLSEAEDDLQETQYDQYISDQKTLLDKLYTQYEETLNSRLDDVSGLISECIGAVNENAETISNSILTASKNVGYTVSEDLKSVWDVDSVINDQTSVLATYGDNFLNHMTTLTTVVSTIQQSIADMYKNSTAEGILSQMKQNSASWWSSNTEERKGLHEQNELLAGQYRLVTGDNLYYDSYSGSWKHEDGSLLYKVDSPGEQTIADIVAKMKRNSAYWNSVSNAEKENLSSENDEYAKRVAQLSGKNVWKDSSGVWWIGNDELYKKYHTGLEQGVVGQNRLKNNEELAVLLSDEIVLTEEQWRSNVKKLTNGVSDTLGYAVEAMLVSIQDFIPENSASHVSGLLKTLDCPNSATEYNNEFNNTFVLNFEMQDVQNYEQFMTKMQNDRKFAQLVQEITLSQLTGSPSLAKNRIQF